ncbi:NAD(P)-binding protein [Xylaria sp. CBS 124048]|nr:NAD(P)-binding protein [Xylaria sp. CBS 124048]
MAETRHFLAQSLFSTKGFVAVVTGGGTGIGLMATQALAANGAKVYITGRRMEVLENAAKSHQPQEGGGSIIPMGPCDVTKQEDLKRLTDAVGEREKYIHLLVCNAGVSGPKAEPEPTDAQDLQARLWGNEDIEDWQNAYRTNVTAVYFTTVAFLPLLQASMRTGGGPLEPFSSSVLTISSISGMMRNSQGHFSYNTAKGATIQLTRLMSAEFQKTGIRVNSIAPGYFPSEMTAGESDERQKSHVSEEKIQEKGHVPLQRPGREIEMGMSVLYLAKNQYVNGEIIAVDGGVMNVVAGR